MFPPDESRADEYRQSLETELYGLPPSKLAESIAARSSYVPSSYRRELSVAGPGIGDRIKRLTSKSSMDAARDVPLSPEIDRLQEQEDIIILTGTDSSSPPARQQLSVDEDTTACRISANSSPIPPCASSGSFDQATSPTNPSKSTTIPRSSSDQAIQQRCDNLPSDQLKSQLGGKESRARTPDDIGQQKASTVEQGSRTQSPSDQQVSTSELEHDTPSSNGNTPDLLKESSEDRSGEGDRAPSPYRADQLKLLTVANRPNGGSGGDRREMSPVRSEKSDYEKITMEAAALSREKWKLSEGVV
jgi:hypothetical protein